MHRDSHLCAEIANICLLLFYLNKCGNCVSKLSICLKLWAALTYLDLKMGNNKTEITKKQGKREKTAATPNQGKKQTTETAGNYEDWQPLTPQKPVGYPEEVLEKLSSLDEKMSGLETLPKQMCDLASTLNSVSSDVELLHKEIKRLSEENCFLREKIGH